MLHPFAEHDDLVFCTTEFLLGSDQLRLHLL